VIFRLTFDWYMLSGLTRQNNTFQQHTATENQSDLTKVWLENLAYFAAILQYSMDDTTKSLTDHLQILLGAKAE